MTTPSYNRTDLSDQALKAWQAAHPDLAPDHGTPAPEFHVNHDYDKPETITLPQLRAMLADLHHRMDAVVAELATLRAGLQQAATPPPTPAAPQAGDTETMLAETVVYSVDENGRDAYKLRGGMYSKSGIRIWPEVLKEIIPDPSTLRPGPTKLEKPVSVILEMSMRPGKSDIGEDPNKQYRYAKKVNGLA